MKATTGLVFLLMKVSDSPTDNITMAPPLPAPPTAADLLNRWVSSWVSLEEDGELLRWFKTKPDDEGPRKSAGSINMANVADVRDRDDRVAVRWPPGAEANTCFMLGTPSKGYFFVAENEDVKR